MRLQAEIMAVLGEGGIQYTVVGGKGGYFQNVKRLLEFSPDRVVLRGKEGSLAVEGRGLSLGKYCAGDVAVFGDILSVRREE